MHEFTLKDPRPMGEKDPKYGQSYWCYTHESNMPVKFNLMEGTVSDGQKITCEEYTVRKSSKGTEYQQLKKVRVAGVSSTQPKLDGTTAKKEWTRDDDRIVAQWAIGQAVGVYGDKVDEVETYARTLFKMVERVKKVNEPEVKEQAQVSNPDERDEDTVYDVDESTPINLDDIPF